jgi:hypothetical protein
MRNMFTAENLAILPVGGMLAQGPVFVPVAVYGQSGKDIVCHIHISLAPYLFVEAANECFVWLRRHSGAGKSWDLGTWACRLVTAEKASTMDFFARLTFGYFQQDSPSISMQARGCLFLGYSKPATTSRNRSFNNPIRGFKSSSSSANPRMFFIMVDCVSEALFRLFHAARDARITGKVESDHGNLGMMACARSRMASAFSTLSLRLSA